MLKPRSRNPVSAPAPCRNICNDCDHRGRARVSGRAVRVRPAAIEASAESLGQPTQEGRGSEVATLYRTEGPRLRRWLARRLPPDRAADLVQITFARFMGLAPARRAALVQPQAYLARIAGNLARDEAKIAARRAQHLHVDIDDCKLAGADATALLEARDMLRCIDAAMEALPDRTREIFMAHRFEELTYPEIAQRMGISVKTVEKHISAALKNLHRALGRTA